MDRAELDEQARHDEHFGWRRERDTLREENKRLRALLVRLTATEPVGVDGIGTPVCAYCFADLDRDSHEHRLDCPWLAARKEVEATSE